MGDSWKFRRIQELKKKEKREADKTSDKRYRITYQDKSEEIQVLTTSQVDTLKITNFVESVVEINE